MTNRDQRKLRAMRAGGGITGRILQTLLSALRPGITTAALDARAERMIQQSGGKPSFKMVDDYKWSTCITINDEIVHGVPSKKKIVAGDIVSIDVGVYFDGYHTDAAWTVIVPDEHGRSVGEKEKFLTTGKKALHAAIERARVGGSIGDISATIQEFIEGAGYSVSRAFTGHGIGRRLHEEPTIRGIGKPKTGMKIIEGATLAIEVIYAMGSHVPVYTRDDGWTVATEDGSLAGLFEHTIAVTKKGPIILTFF